MRFEPNHTAETARVSAPLNSGKEGGGVKGSLGGGGAKTASGNVVRQKKMASRYFGFHAQFPPIMLATQLHKHHARPTSDQCQQSRRTKRTVLFCLNKLLKAESIPESPKKKKKLNRKIQM